MTAFYAFTSTSSMRELMCFKGSTTQTHPSAGVQSNARIATSIWISLVHHMRRRRNASVRCVFDYVSSLLDIYWLMMLRQTLKTFQKCSAFTEDYVSGCCDFNLCRALYCFCSCLQIPEKDCLASCYDILPCIAAPLQASIHHASNPFESIFLSTRIAYPARIL